MILANQNAVKWVLGAALFAAFGLVACDNLDLEQPAPTIAPRAKASEPGNEAPAQLESEQMKLVPGSTGLLTQLPKELWKAYPLDSECCTEPGQFDNCWFRDAEMDGTTCEQDDDCATGQTCSVYGLCTCQTNADCNDGVCNEAKICGPSWCNGHFVCSCFGGCQWWQEDEDYTPNQLCAEQGLSCCDGRYPYHPDSVAGELPMPGYCTDSGDCELRCRTDAECNDGNACTVDTCTNENACGEDERGCTHTIIDGLDCDGSPTDTQSSECTHTVCRDVDPDPCVVDAQCVPETVNIGSVCTENPQIPDGWHGDASRAGDADGSSCFTLACDAAGECAADAVDDGEELSCDDVDYLATGVANPCTDELCVGGACVHVADDHVGEACEHDNDLCTAGVCTAAGACEHDEPNDVSCLVDQCNLSSCNPTTGLCEFNNDARFGAQCNLDTNGCTVETCQCAGACACVGGACEEELACTAESDITCVDDDNACTSDACTDEATEANPHDYVCAYGPMPTGTACNFDDNGCTAGDACVQTGDSSICTPGAAVDCVAELAGDFGAVDLDCNAVSCDAVAGDPDSHACEFSHDLTTPAGGCDADGDGCTLDVCDVEADPALQLAPALCQAGDPVDCDSLAPHTQCQSVACSVDAGNPFYDYQCDVSDLASATACEDGDVCTAGDQCDGSGTCVAGTNPCAPSDTCHDVSCGPDGGGSYACTEIETAGCCLDASDCDWLACPGTAAPPAGCSTVACVDNACVCNNEAVATACTDYSQATYPPSCYDGACDASGNCVPTLHAAYNNLCSDVFDPVDRTAVDETANAFIGSFANTDANGTILSATGSTLCAYNNYEALGDNCKEYDGVSFTRDIGTGGRDLVYAFRYQTNAENQFELYSYVVKVQANFDVGVYVKTDIHEASDCPEGDDPSADDPTEPGGFHGDLFSNRCSFPYDLGVGLPPPTVVEDECSDDGNTIVGQDCCDPCVDGDKCGYKWCKRGYNFDGSDCDMCAGVTEGSPPADYDPETWLGNCDALWLYPDAPFECGSTVPEDDPAYASYTSMASAVISPQGIHPTDLNYGDWKTVFIVVDGVESQAGEFYLTIEKRRWWSSPCDRVDDDFRVYDVTHPDDGASTYLGSFQDVVNSFHSNRGPCGGYSCNDDAWTGVSPYHDSGDPNEFWPAGEYFKIQRSSYEGRATYCVMSNEAVPDSADLVATFLRRANNYDTICDAGYRAMSSVHDNWGQNIMVEFEAYPEELYLIEISDTTYRNVPCDPKREACNYALTVSEGRCVLPCVPPKKEVAGPDVEIVGNSGSETRTGTIRRTSGNQFNQELSKNREDDVYRLFNRTGSTKRIDIEICGDKQGWISIFGCQQSNDFRLLLYQKTGRNKCDTVYDFPLPDSNSPYYLVADSKNQAMGDYEVTVSW